MTLDASAYPHILDSVLAYASRDALLSLRGASHGLRDSADARLYRHAALHCSPDTVALRAPNGDRLPHLPSALPTSRLNLIWILDVRDPDTNTNTNTNPDGPLSVLLPALHPHIVRQLGTYRLALTSHTHIDWMWYTPHPVLPSHSLLRYANTPIPASRVVLHCNTTFPAALLALRHLPIPQLVLVFNSRWDQLPEWEVALSFTDGPKLLARILDQAEVTLMKFALALTLLAFVAATPLDVTERTDASVNAREAEAEPATLLARGSFTGTANPPSGVTLKCRKGASTAQGVTTTFSRGQAIKIKCQQLGETISGNAVWNKIDRSWAPDCYVSDYYTKTGYKWIPGVPRC
ncbi:hypothetical protein CspHIS471_0208180 [Cutaneotrichosporon sp. HIS471]|nr:hypothetical protein CspHIS471_0208180 [Cutaneotrichosporon sp. HIS471]